MAAPGTGGASWRQLRLLPLFDSPPILRAVERGPIRRRIGLEIASLREATAAVVEHHYLHRGRTMAQLAYWILVDGRRCGVLLFAYPRLSAGYQGMGPMQVLELARLWIDPAVQGRRVVDRDGREHAYAVASCAVGYALRRVRQDWRAKYPHLPQVLAVVAWADTGYHEGTVYRACNFREVRYSGGARARHRPSL